MPGKPRAETIDPSAIGTYHAMSRCVRQAFLLGRDRTSRRDASHRKRWIQHRVRSLARHFGIELLFFGFLSNHFHLILRNRPDLVEGWNDEEVICRACRIFPWKFSRLGVAPHSRPAKERLAELVADRELVREMRTRLADPSWFMRQLNQYVATRANREDKCDGHFFEQRFKAEPISDLFALVVCGLYVDLNELAAGVADSAEDSRNSSVNARLRAKKLRADGKPFAIRADGFLTPVFLREPPDRYPAGGSRGAYRTSGVGLLDMSLDQYVALFNQLAEHYRSVRRGRGRKPPLPIDAIAEHLHREGVLAHITSDVA